MQQYEVKQETTTGVGGGMHSKAEPEEGRSLLHATSISCTANFGADNVSSMYKIEMVTRCGLLDPNNKDESVGLISL